MAKNTPQHRFNTPKHVPPHSSWTPDQRPPGHLGHYGNTDGNAIDASDAVTREEMASRDRAIDDLLERKRIG